MPRRDPRLFLHEIVTAADELLAAIDGKSYQDFVNDRVLRRAVERNFEIIGEATRRAIEGDERVRDAIPEAHAIIALRNILAHGYWTVRTEELWSIATERVPQLRAVVKDILPSLGDGAS
jgi:uncharacterized protein with HEPN domain